MKGALMRASRLFSAFSVWAARARRGTLAEGGACAVMTPSARTKATALKSVPWLRMRRSSASTTSGRASAAPMVVAP